MSSPHRLGRLGRPLACALLALAALPPATAALQRDELPPLRTRRAAERHSVAVRVEDPLREPTYGTGFVVAEDEDRYVVATARHVIEGAGEAGRRLTVLPYAHVVWIDATVLASGDPELGEESDLAFLAIDRARTEFLSGALVASFQQAAVLGLDGDDPLWAIGWDHYEEAFWWKEGRVQEVTPSQVVFEGRGVRPGFSGGLLVTPSGAIGMTTRTGSRGRDSLALRLDHLQAAAAAAEVPFEIASPLIEAAFANAREEGLLVSLCSRPINRWFMLEVDSIGGAGIEGRWATFGPDNNAGAYGSRGTWRAVVEGEALSFTMEGADRLLANAGQRRRFVPAADLAVPGHLVLSSGTDADGLDLAIPREVCEMLGARLLASSVDPKKDQIAVDRDLVVPTDSYRDGGRARMGVFLNPRGLNNNPLTDFRMLFHPGWEGSPVRLEGRLLGSDQIKELDHGEMRDWWLEMPIGLVSETSGQPVGAILRDPDQPLDHDFSVELEVEGTGFRFRLERLDAKQRSRGGVFALERAVLFRSE